MISLILIALKIKIRDNNGTLIPKISETYLTNSLIKRQSRKNREERVISANYEDIWKVINQIRKLSIFL